MNPFDDAHKAPAFPVFYQKLKQASNKKVISFSVYGDRSVYLIGAEKNIDIAKKALITQGLVHASMFKSCEISRSNSSHNVLFIIFPCFFITNPNLINSVTQKNRYFT